VGGAWAGLALGGARLPAACFRISWLRLLAGALAPPRSAPPPNHPTTHPPPTPPTSPLPPRPEGYLGELETWNKAEAALTEALNSTGREWTINEADGAFYGPKIDITGGRGGRPACGSARLGAMPHGSLAPASHLGSDAPLASPRCDPYPDPTRSPPPPQPPPPVYDALRRKFQCATVQLDFQMPIR
jgi:hypothetical protein